MSKHKQHQFHQLYSSHTLRRSFIFITSKLWKQRAINDATQLCVCCGRGARTLATKSVGLGRHCCCWVTGLRPWESDNGSQVFTAYMFTVLRLISLTVALAAGSARVTGHGASKIIIYRVECNKRDTFTHSYTHANTTKRRVYRQYCLNTPLCTSNTLETNVINRRNANTITHSYKHARTMKIAFKR